MAVKTDRISRHALGLSPRTSEYPYQGMQHFQDVMHKEAAEAKHDYVIFTNIDENTFLQDFEESQSHSYSDFFPRFQTLIATMPTTEAHEEAHLEIHNTLITRLVDLNVRTQLQSLGRADVVTPTRTKQPDQSYRPVQLPAGRSNQWPSLVVESAYSETQSKLASDARWWLNASGGDVKTAITVSVQKKRNAITIEKWEAIGRPTRAEPGKRVPEVVQKVAMTRGDDDDAPVHITGAPLVIEFEKLFLRPADEKKGEGDVVMDQNDLTLIAKLTWATTN